MADSSTDYLAYGDLFQWGRQDDGHQLINWTGSYIGEPLSGTTSTLATTDNPGHDDFILTNDSPYDWRDDNNHNRWNANPVENNPCPTGWRVPTEAEWDLERLSWGENDYTGAYNSPLKLPVTATRDGGGGWLANVGGTGSYWSSTVDDSNSLLLTFDSMYAGISWYTRSFGNSVRCIKD